MIQNDYIIKWIVLLYFLETLNILIKLGFFYSTFISFAKVERSFLVPAGKSTVIS
jgi:hypothetical protein